MQAEYHVTVTQTSNCHQKFLCYLWKIVMFLSGPVWLTIWTSSYERVVEIVVVLNAQIKLFFSRLRHQFYSISGVALRTKFEIYEVANVWLIFPQYIGMGLFPMHAVSARKIWILLKIIKVNITSKRGYCDSKLYFHLGKMQFGIVYTYILNSERKKDLRIFTVGQYT